MREDKGLFDKKKRAVAQQIHFDGKRLPYYEDEMDYGKVPKYDIDDFSEEELGSTEKIENSDMPTLRFTDGEVFDTSGELRVERRYDGLYVVGKGFLIPVNDKVEAKEWIERWKKKNQ